MSGELTNSEACQVDFYLLGNPSAVAAKLACRLALMAWERKQNIFIITRTKDACEELLELMWQFPDERFLPHADTQDRYSDKAPVNIGTLSSLNPTDVVINLCPEAVPQPERFSRILEIVPHAEDERQASRVKYKTYLNQGLKPKTHNING